MSARNDEGYLCDVVAHPFDVIRAPVLLAEHRAPTSRLALVWLRGQAERLAGALDPIPGKGALPESALRVVERPSATPNPGRIFRVWLSDEMTQETQRRNLTCGHRVHVVAGDEQALYALTARPIPSASA
ncbi:hypothetical protein [Streptomyces sp. WMMC1477]|uniref:hypothetical protein n=1 Tax=Streptomyces sp. WMMC1477 TaxID=3015155 RepID=UPI0022B63B10|nr:hypothetical protein [Streptomyces sp. WMMC1477]MCZ7433158.1 hypothetical protein [Streptomyces sp. WMMC1477]